MSFMMCLMETKRDLLFPKLTTVTLCEDSLETKNDSEETISKQNHSTLNNITEK